MLRNPRVQGAGDALLAFVLAATSVVPVLGGDPSWGRPKALGIVLALASTVPVAWRARRPLTVCAVVLAANGGCVYVAAPLQAAFQPFLALVLCGYSVGSRAEGRRALWVPAVLAVAAIPMFALAVASRPGPGERDPVLRLADRGLGGRAHRPAPGARRHKEPGARARQPRA